MTGSRPIKNLRMNNITSTRATEIKNEIDFIFRVKDQYIRKTNERAALAIQTLMKGAIQRQRYLRWRNSIIPKVVKI